MHGAYRCSLSTRLSYDYVDFDTRLESDPGCVGDMGRVYAHEVLHVWQTVGQAFHDWLATEECRDLDGYATAGSPAAITAILSKPSATAAIFLDAPDPPGFSAYDLTEALARYWDVFLTAVPGRAVTPGQVREAMLAEDRYAAPFRLLDEDRWWVLTEAYFPLVAHFALQTRQPAQAFAIFASALDKSNIPSGGFPSLIFDSSGLVDINLPRHILNIYNYVRRVCARAAKQVGLHGITDGVTGSDDESDNANVIGRHYRFLVEAARSLWGPHRVDKALATPGLHWNFLMELLPPAVTMLRGGTWAGQGSLRVAFIQAALSEETWPAWLPTSLKERVRGPAGASAVTNALAAEAMELCDRLDRLQFERLKNRKLLAVRLSSQG